MTWAVAVLRHVDGPRGEHWLHQHQDWPARGQRRFVHGLEQILLCWHHTPFTLLAMAPNDGRLRVYASAFTPSALSSLAYRVKRCTTKDVRLWITFFWAITAFDSGAAPAQSDAGAFISRIESPQSPAGRSLTR